MLGNIPFTDIYEDIENCETAKEFEGLKIIRYEASVYYANVDNFVYKIFKLSGTDPADLIAKINKKRTDNARLTKKFKETQVNEIKD